MELSSWRIKALVSIITTTRVFVAIGFLTATAAGESIYCTFEIKVSTPSGAPRPKTPVMLLRDKAMFSETTTDANGLARLCDAPLQAVDIAVGVDVCGLVIVHDLHSRWPETNRIFVTFAENPCSHFIPPQYCQVLLRIQDEDGRPVVAAKFDGKRLNGSSGSDVSDELGRLYRLVRRGDKLEGVVTEGRGREARVSVLATDDLEMKVVLRQR